MVVCSPGKYCPTQSTTAATCPAGSYCSSPSDKAACDAGYACPSGSTAKQLCLAGTYSPPGASSHIPAKLGIQLWCRFVSLSFYILVHTRGALGRSLTWMDAPVWQAQARAQPAPPDPTARSTARLRPPAAIWAHTRPRPGRSWCARRVPRAPTARIQPRSWCAALGPTANKDPRPLLPAPRAASARPRAHQRPLIALLATYAGRPA